ncbi:MAG: 1,4-dihydroxy-6-naphtoate synthase [Phycisphaerae bacterium]|nr:1,4-dihydroxy-6-naphtoate synthase [Phycisphaerae bacterium]
MTNQPASQDSQKKHLLLGHSPDADDAFMFYALSKNLIPTGPWYFEHILQDIQTLNERAMRAELDITAVSIHAYPYLSDNYMLMDFGCSMGDGYGPMIIAPKKLSINELNGKTILVPGRLTTAFLALQLLLGQDTFNPVVTPFDEIISRVAAGEADAGLIIHEGQLVYQESALHCIVDLGAWWKELTGLPLPLGGNAIRRSIGPPAIRDITSILRASVQYALDHRTEAIVYARQFGRILNDEQADRFVGMYVNHWTLEYGDIGRQAVQTLLNRAYHHQLISRQVKVDFPVN